MFAYRTHEFIQGAIGEMYIARFLKMGYTEYEAQIQALKKLDAEGVIDFWEVESDGKKE